MSNGLYEQRRDNAHQKRDYSDQFSDNLCVYVCFQRNSFKFCFVAAEMVACRSEPTN